MSRRRREASAVPMIIRCYYRQWPQDYGRPMIDEPEGLRTGVCEEIAWSTEVLPPEPMGDPDAR